jgi:hypothetical protein
MLKEYINNIVSTLRIEEVAAMRTYEVTFD